MDLGVLVDLNTLGEARAGLRWFLCEAPSCCQAQLARVRKLVATESLLIRTLSGRMGSWNTCDLKVCWFLLPCVDQVSQVPTAAEWGRVERERVGISCS